MKRHQKVLPNLSTNSHRLPLFERAFTIVELLVVIVVIGILAAITIVSYSSISSKAIAALVSSDLDSNNKLLKMYNVDHGYYPNSLDSNNCPNAPDADSRYCLKSSNGTTIDYSGSGQNFVLTIAHTASGVSRQITENGISYAVTGNGSSSFVKKWDGPVDSYSGADSIASTSDGGYVITGSTDGYGAGAYDIFISKYNSDGTLQWTRIIGEAGGDYVNSIIQTSDGGYAITGFVDVDNNESSAAFVAKLSSSGSVSWNKTWDRTGNSEGRSITQLSDGGLVVIGPSRDPDVANCDGFVLKYDVDDGDLTWSKIWTPTNTEYDEFNTVVAANDGGFIISGYTESYDSRSELLVVKMTSNGLLSWSRTWNQGDVIEYAASIVQTSDGGYAITGDSHSSFITGNSDIIVIKLDSNGATQWAKAIGDIDSFNGGYESGSKIIQAFDSSLVIFGDWTVAINISNSGSVSWIKYWYMDAGINVRSATQLSDGGFVAAGGFDDGVLSYKIRTDGSMKTCDPGTCFNGIGAYTVKNITAGFTDRDITLKDPTQITGSVSLTESNVSPTATTIIAP